MTFWEILGIEATTDIRKIRHAYASLSKECHPETEPEKFQQLYQAYQKALAFAKENRTPLRESTAGESREELKEGTAQESPDGSRQREELKADTEQAAASMFDGLEQMSEEADDAPLEPELQIPDYIKNISGQSTAVIAEGLEAFRETFEAKGKKDWEKFMTRPEFLRVQFEEGFVVGLSDYLMRQTIYPVEKLPFDLVKELVFAYNPFMEEHWKEGVLLEDDGFSMLVDVLNRNERFAAVIRKLEAPNMLNQVVKYWAYYGIYSSIKKNGEVQDSKHWNRYLAEIAGRLFYLKDGVKTQVDKNFYPMFEFLIREGPTFSQELYSYLIERFKLADAEHSSRWQDVRGIYRAIEEKGIVIEDEKKAQEKQRKEIRILMDEIEKLYCLDAESDRGKIREFFRSEIYDRHKLDAELLDDKLHLFACVDARLFSKVFTEEYIKFYDEVYAKTPTETGKKVYTQMQYYRNTDLAIGEGFSEITENRQEWVLKYFFEEGFTRAWPSLPKGGMPVVYRELLTDHLWALSEQRHYEWDLETDGHLYALRKEGSYLFVYDNMCYAQTGEKAALTIQEYYQILENLMEFYLENYTCTEETKEQWNNLMERAGEICGSNRN